MDNNILTMTIAPRDINGDQVKFVLERGLPAILEDFVHIGPSSNMF